MRRLSELVVKFRIPIVIFFIVLGAFSAYLASKLIVDSDLMKILPSSDPVIKEYEKYVFGDSSEDVTFIVLKTFEKNEKGMEKLKSSAEAIYEGSEGFPNISEFVRFDYLSELGPVGLIMVDPSAMMAFGVDNQDLAGDLQKLLNYDFSAIHSIGSTLSRLKDLESIVGDTGAKDSIDSYIRIPETIDSEDPMMLVMAVGLDGPSSDVGYVDRTIPALRDWITKKIEPYGVSFALTGSHPSTYESHMQTNRDFMFTTIISLVGITLIFLIAYSSFRVTIYIFTGLAISMFTTLGIAYVIFGSLNIITTFLNAITLGLGIDYGIHVITRMTDEAKREKDPVKIILNTYRAITKPLIVSMGTTIFVFAVLSVINSPAVRELGILTSIGITVFFVVMYIFLPAISINTIMKAGASAGIHSLDKFFNFISSSIRRFSVVSGTLVMVVLLVFGYMGTVNLSNFSYTPPGLVSFESEAMSTTRMLEKAFGSSIMNKVPFMAKDIPELREITNALNENSNIKGVFSILDLIEGGDEEYMKQFRTVVREANNLRNSPLFEAVLKKARYYDFMIELLDKTETIENSNELLELIVDIVPPSLKSQFIYESPGGERYFVVSAEPVAGLYTNNVIKILFDSVGDLEENIGGYPKIFHHLMEVVKSAMLPVSAISMLCVFLAVFIERRSFFDALKVFILMFGILIAMFGFMELVGIEVTFITIISAPLIVGIGVDSLIHMLHGSIKSGNNELSRTMKSVVMSSVTTIFTFMSFAFAQGRLLSSFGIALGSGVLLSLIVATFLVPVLPWNKKNNGG